MKKVFIIIGTLICVVAVLLYSLLFNKKIEDIVVSKYSQNNIVTDIYYKTKAILSIGYFENDKIFYNKSNNFIFSKKHIPSTSMLSHKRIADTAYYLDKINNYCLKNNIKLYVLIVPFNQFIYQQYAKPYDNDIALQTLNNNIKMLQSATQAKVIYPYSELLAASQEDWVFFKTDSNWTDLGAFVGYQSLMKEINKDFPNVKPVLKDDFQVSLSKEVRSNFNRKFNEGEEYTKGVPYLLSRKNKILDTEYKYLTHRNSSKLKTTKLNNEHEKSKVTNYSDGANYKVIELGDRVNENLLQYISYTFQYVKYIRIDGVKNRDKDEKYKVIKYYEDDIKSYKPNIMIIAINVNNVKRLGHFLEK